MPPRDQTGEPVVSRRLTVTKTAPHPASERGSRCDAFIGALVAIGLIALAIRLITALSSPEPAFISDPTFFRLQGMLLATGRGFADPFVWSSQHRIVATAFHPPLFSTFLGGIYRMGFHSVAAARVGSCLLGTATVVFVGLTGREVSGRRVGLVAASIAALTPNLWVPDGALTSEGLATTFVAATLWLAYRFLRNPRRGTAIWLGISIGLAGLTRPETLALAAIVVVPITVHLALPIRRRLSLVAIAFLAMLIVIAPWTIRSATLFERPVLISTNGQAVIGYANCPARPMRVVHSAVG